MEKLIISSFDGFKKHYKEAISSDNERNEALKRYFEKGGFVSVRSLKEKPWPLLIYPSKQRIAAQLKELHSMKSLFSKKQADWKIKHFQARTYDLKNQLKKFTEKSYWEHMLKFLRDSDYREDAKKVKLPAKLVADPKFKPMIKMFVSDAEYRKQLIETVEHSIVYKDDKSLGKYASFLKEFRKSVSEGKIKSTKKKIEELDKDIKMYNALQKWSGGLV